MATRTACLHRAYAEDENLTKLKNVWLDLPSQRSGVTYNYLLILAGFQSLKPDRMVIRFIKENAELGNRPAVQRGRCCGLG